MGGSSVEVSDSDVFWLMTLELGKGGRERGSI
jgi:hypothetical protein